MRPVAAALLACAAASAAAAEGAWAPRWRIEATGTHSHWSEHDEAGRLLLTERGDLPGLALHAAWDVAEGVAWNQAPPLTVELGLQAARGTRDYDGRSSGGAIVRSDAAIGMQSLRLGLALPLAPGWQATLAVEPHWLRRDLHGVGTIAGYVEHWRWTLLLPGLRLHQGDWQLDAGIGAAVAASVQVALPGRDPAELQPRPRPSWRIEAAWRPDRPASSDDEAPRWRPVLALRLGATRFGASDAVPLLSAGVLRGGLMQPAATQRQAGLHAGLEVDWR